MPGHDRHSSTILAACAACAVMVAGGGAGAADFYAGKDIEMTVGSAPGGGYDTYARIVAKHLPDHIAGSPNIVVKNMPGAGSGKAATYIYTVAPRDGTAIGALFPGALMGPLLDDRVQVNYQPTKFVYLVSADSGTRVCATRGESKVKTLRDAMKVKASMGASQAGGSTRDYAILLNSLAGTKFDVISGYKGSAAILLAMERGEVDGVCGLDWTSLKSQRPSWINEGKINILVQVGPDPEPELAKKGVPEIWDFVKGEDARQAVELIVGQQVFGRPYVAPPGTPAERVATLRQGFAAALKDPDLLRDAEKSRLSIKPAEGKRVQDLVEKLYATPKPIVEKAKQAMGVSESKS